jgi:hypothetical protein
MGGYNNLRLYGTIWELTSISRAFELSFKNDNNNYYENKGNGILIQNSEDLPKNFINFISESEDLGKLLIANNITDDFF